MRLLSTSLLGFAIIVAVFFSVNEAASLTNDQETLVYVFGSEGVYIIDPKSKTVLSNITDGICTKSNNRYSRKKCSFGTEIVVKDELVFFSDSPGNRVHVIDVEKRQVIETIPTGGYPYDMYYLPWLEEVWVHTWTNSTFDVISTAGSLEKTHKAIKAHVQPGWTHGYMYADQEVKDGKVGYVTHLFNPGLHQLDLSSKTYKDFVNVSNYGCKGTFNFAYSSVNRHAFFDCYGSNTLLELDVSTDEVVRKWNFTGALYASPDGRFIVSLYKSVNESINMLLASKVYVLVFSDKDNAPTLKAPIDIPGGVSDLVFDPKNDLAYISLIYNDKIAVLDLILLKVTYIEGVGSVLSGPGMHAVSRPLIMAGSWIVTPATANNSIVIINAATRELHGMVLGVTEGKGLVAVHQKAKLPPPKSVAGSFHVSREMLVLILLSALYVMAGLDEELK